MIWPKSFDFANRLALFQSLSAHRNLLANRYPIEFITWRLAIPSLVITVRSLLANSVWQTLCNAQCASSRRIAAKQSISQFLRRFKSRCRSYSNFWNIRVNFRTVLYSVLPHRSSIAARCMPAMYRMLSKPGTPKPTDSQMFTSLTELILATKFISYSPAFPFFRNVQALILHTESIAGRRIFFKFYSSRSFGLQTVAMT